MLEQLNQLQHQITLIAKEGGQLKQASSHNFAQMDAAIRQIMGAINVMQVQQRRICVAIDKVIEALPQEKADAIKAWMVETSAPVNQEG